MKPTPKPSKHLLVIGNTSPNSREYHYIKYQGERCYIPNEVRIENRTIAAGTPFKVAHLKTHVSWETSPIIMTLHPVKDCKIKLFHACMVTEKSKHLVTLRFSPAAEILEIKVYPDYYPKNLRVLKELITRDAANSQYH